MKIKVCGITTESQYASICTMQIDMVGFNFYRSSKRYLKTAIPKLTDNDPARVGVFVNEPMDSIIKIYQDHQLDYAQLHGDEDVDYITMLPEYMKIIKVFRIDNKISNIDFDALDPFVAFYLFDKHSDQYGGSGKKFDWDLMKQLTPQKAIILSGGISYEDLDTLANLKVNNLWGVDINSRFETSPGLKDLAKLKSFSDILNNEQNESKQI